MIIQTVDLRCTLYYHIKMLYNEHNLNNTNIPLIIMIIQTVLWIQFVDNKYNANKNDYT